MTEKECEACEKNRKGVYATPFGADHHHARIAELEQERDSMEVSRDLAEAEELKTRKERDSALEGGVERVAKSARSSTACRTTLSTDYAASSIPLKSPQPSRNGTAARDSEERRESECPTRISPSHKAGGTQA